MSARDPFLPDRRVRALVLGVAAAALLVFGWVNVRDRARLDGPQRHGSDFTVYTAAADAIAVGRSPYDAANPAGWGYIYPPLFAILVSPLRHLEPTAQAWCWFLVTLAAAFASYGETVRLVTWADGVAAPEGVGDAAARVPRWLGLTSVATIFSPGIATMKWGQVGILLLFLLLLGTRLVATSARAWTVALGGLTLALAVAIKLGPAVPAGCLLAAVCWAGFAEQRGSAGRQRFAVAGTGFTCGLVLWFLLVPAARVGWGSNVTWLTEFADRVVLHLGTGSRVGVDLRSPGNFQMANAVRVFARAVEHKGFASGELLPKTLTPAERAAYFDVIYSVPTAVDAGVGRAALIVLLLTVAASAVAGVAALARESRLGAGAPAAMALGILPVLLLSPISWTHHYVLLQPASVFVPLWCWQRGARRSARVLAGWLALSVCGQFLLLPRPWRGLPWLPLLTAIWLCVTAGIALRVRARDARRSTPPPL